MSHLSDIFFESTINNLEIRINLETGELASKHHNEPDNHSDVSE